MNKLVVLIGLLTIQCYSHDRLQVLVRNDRIESCELISSSLGKLETKQMLSSDSSVTLWTGMPDESNYERLLIKEPGLGLYWSLEIQDTASSTKLTVSVDTEYPEYAQLFELIILETGVAPEIVLQTSATGQPELLVNGEVIDLTVSQNGEMVDVITQGTVTTLQVFHGVDIAGP